MHYVRFLSDSDAQFREREGVALVQIVQHLLYSLKLRFVRKMQLDVQSNGSRRHGQLDRFGRYAQQIRQLLKPTIRHLRRHVVHARVYGNARVHQGVDYHSRLHWRRRRGTRCNWMWGRRRRKSHSPRPAVADCGVRVLNVGFVGSTPHSAQNRHDLRDRTRERVCVRRVRDTTKIARRRRGLRQRGRYSSAQTIPKEL